MSQGRSSMLTLAAALAIVAAVAAGLATRSDVATDEAGHRSAVGGKLTRLGDNGPAPQSQIAYVVQAGDTLGGIADRFGTTIEALIKANGLADADAIQIGQELQLGLVPDRDGPAVRTVPDSEVTYGPAYLGFDVATYLAAQSGYLTTYTESVSGELLTGPQILDRIAREFLVGPRVLLAVVEARSGWVTGTPGDPAAWDYPAGLADPARSGLWRQLNWLADRLNAGYYDWRTRDARVIVLADGTTLAGAADLGAGSFAVQYALGRQSTEAELPIRLSELDEAYRRLFGDPWAGERPATDLGRLDFPELRLPFASGETWWFTGGPHGGWADGSAWSALDMLPDEEQRGCFVSVVPARAVADGTVVDARPGSVWLDLDSDGRRETGPAVFYLHITLADGVVDGLRVESGQVLGYPSCEGGSSIATHLHIARAYDGEWLAAAGIAPFVLGGWTAGGAPSSYDGTLTHADGRRREACECRQAAYNDLTW